MIDEKDIAEIVLQKYSSIYARLVSVARRFGHTALVDQVEDCIQDALMLLYERREAYEDHNNLAGWIYLAALHNLQNRCRTTRRRDRVTGYALDDESDYHSVSHMQANQAHEDLLRDLERKSDMLSAIKDALDPESFEFLTAYFDDEITAKRLAAKYGVSEDSIWKRKQRLIEKVRRAISNSTLTILMSGSVILTTLISEGGEDHAEKQLRTGGENHGDTAPSLSKQGAQVILRMLERQPPYQVDYRLMEICLAVLHEGEPEADPAVVKRAVRTFKRRVAQRKAEQRAANRMPGHPNRRAAVALVLVGVLALMAAVAYALGWLPWQRIVSTDRERYYVDIDMTNEMTVDPLTRFLPTGLDSDLDKVLEEHQIFIPLPTWIPEGYGHPEIQVHSSEISTTLFINFANGEGKLLSLDVTRYVLSSDEESSMQSHRLIEKDDDYFEEYVRGDTVYTLLSNLGWLETIWSRQPYECQMGGYISAEDMHRMIDSIYERST